MGRFAVRNGTMALVFVAASLAMSPFDPAAAQDTSIVVPLPVDETAEGRPLLNDGESKSKAALKSVSGIVNVVRKGERVEVVMRGTGDVYQLPRGSKQAAIFKALTASEKNGTGVNFLVDERSNVIRSIGSGGGSPTGGAGKTQ